MMKTIKIFSLLVVVLILLCSAIKVTAAPISQNLDENYYTVDGVEFPNTVKNDGTWFYRPNIEGVIIVAYKGNETEVVIPEEINGESVTAIEMWTGFSYKGGTKGFPVFKNKIETLIIPKTLTEIISEDEDYPIAINFVASGLNYLKKYIVDKENPSYCSEDGVLFTKDKTVLMSYPRNKDASEYVIPESVEKIYHCAFSGVAQQNPILQAGQPYYVSKLKKLTITKNVERLCWIQFFDQRFYVETVVFDNVKLQDEDFEKIFGSKETVVYKGSSAYKYYKSFIKKYGDVNLNKLTVLDNKNTKQQTESKEQTSKKPTSNNNFSKNKSEASKPYESAPSDTAESIISKPVESVTTETTESEETLTIGATENNTDTTPKAKPEKSNKVWIIIAAAVLLAGGITTYWFIRKKTKA